jgi:S-adenosylmethionine:tRNA ribosyltransferase-isomerase
MTYSLEDYDFELPPEQIASEALADRSASRMLVVQRPRGGLVDTQFSVLPNYLRKGDLLVLNNTKVFPARLFGISETGARLEIFLVEDLGDKTWSVLARPARRLTAGKTVIFDGELSAKVFEKIEDGRIILRFECDGDLDAAIDRVGRTPLPPYIKRETGALDRDRERYQTVYAKERGAIAAPTAGLHFTPQIFDELRQIGVEFAEITLHVGYGTFEPVRAAVLSEHKVSPERFSISADAARSLEKAKREGRRIIAVGTTTTRTLEYVHSAHGRFTAVSGMTKLTILPGYKFKAIDGLLTNFHLPKSSLLVLVSTFAGHELIMGAYRHAVASGYRFYSYGDCMLIL